MSDTMTVDAAFEQASGSLSSEPAQPEKTPVAEVKTGEITPEAATTEAAEGSKEETFIDYQPDLSKLSPEAKAAAEAMLKDTQKRWEQSYTKKRMAERAELKKYQEELEALKTQQANPDYSRQAQQEYAQRPQNMANMSIEEFQQNIINQTMQTIRGQQETGYLATAQREFYNSDPRLNPDSPDHDQWMSKAVVDDLAARRAEYEEKYGSVLGPVDGSVPPFDFKTATQEIIAEYDKAMQERLDRHIKTVRQTARAHAEKSARLAPSSVGGTGKQVKSMTLDEAFAAAEAEA